MRFLKDVHINTLSHKTIHLLLKSFAPHKKKNHTLNHHYDKSSKFLHKRRNYEIKMSLLTLKVIKSFVIITFFLLVSTFCHYDLHVIIMMFIYMAELSFHTFLHRLVGHL